MNTTLHAPANCPHCGQPLPANAPAGLCPACLLAQGMDTDPGGEPRSRFQPPPVEEIARLFPQLEILGLLGAGGMGAVYKARQPALDRLVALKVLPPQGVGGVDSTERFNREARALARLSHPNIVAVHEFGQVGGLNYFIMEFVDGANLRQLGRAARLSPREALQIIPQICDALQYAHDEGVVHRDIKPENVLVDRKGRVKIADFGLAKIFGPDGDALQLTADGDVMGTPHYMAPEQVERPLAVDHRADIYSLGVVFYELLTGDLPLGKFAPPSRKVSVDVRLDDVVLRALENDPARRYQKVSEVKSQVETITTQPVTTGGSRREEPQTPSISTLPANIIIVACLLLYHGAEALWRALNVANPEAVSFNPGLLALPVGIGLLRLRAIARLAALLLLVVVSCIHLYVIGLLWFAPEVLKTGATLNGIPFDPGAALPLTALIMLGQVALAGWAGWTLTRPAVRTLFTERTVARPWLEWAVLAAVIAVSALAPMWHAANAALGAGGWLLLAGGATFVGWYWFTQSPSSSRGEAAPASSTASGFPSLVASPKLAWVVVPLLVGAGVLLWLGRSNRLVPPAFAPPRVPLIVAKLDPATGILRADVPGGGVIELLGVAETNAAPNQWWRPDGRVATNANYELHNLVEPSRDSGHFRVFVFRAHDLPDDADGPSLGTTERGAMMSSGGTVFSHGKPLSGGRPIVVALREPRRFTAIRAGLAIGPRNTIYSFDPATRKTERTWEPDHPRWEITLHGATDTPTGSQITAVMPRIPGDWQVQLIAMDQTGKERTHRMVSGVGTPSGSDTLWTYNFPGLPLKEVKEFRVVVRRVQQFEFPDVVLEPKGKLPEAKPLRFGTVGWLAWPKGTVPKLDGAGRPVVHHWMDLDNRRTGTLSGSIGTNIQSLAVAQGIDIAMVDKEELAVFDTEFAVVADSAFGEFTPQQVIDSVYRGRFAPTKLRPANADGAPASFCYETREGGFGILQFTRNLSDGSPSGIRIKRIER